MGLLEKYQGYKKKQNDEKFERAKRAVLGGKGMTPQEFAKWLRDTGGVVDGEDDEEEQVGWGIRW